MESWGIVSLESCPAGTQQCSGKFSYIYLPVNEIKIREEKENLKEQGELSQRS